MLILKGSASSTATKGQRTRLAVENNVGPDDVEIFSVLDRTSPLVRNSEKIILVPKSENSSLVKIPITLNCSFERNEVGKNSKKNRKSNRARDHQGPLYVI